MKAVCNPAVGGVVYQGLEKGRKFACVNDQGQAALYEAVIMS